MELSQELNKCTYIKSILMICIVFYHSILFWSGNWFTVVQPLHISKTVHIASLFMNSFHIYGFVLVSGYIYYCLKYHLNKYSDYKSFIIKKFKRLIVPFYAVAFIWIIPVSCIFREFSIKDILMDYVLAENPNQLWFLWMLFWVFFFSFALSKVFKENTLVSVVIVLALYFIGIVCGLFFPSIFRFFEGLTFVVYFYLGFVIAQGKLNFFKRINCFCWFGAFLVLFAIKLILLEFSDGSFYKLLSLCIDLPLHSVGALMSYYMIGYFYKYSSLKNTRLFSVFSKVSMSVFLFHQQIINVAIFVLNGKINDICLFALSFISGIVVSCLIGIVFNKFSFTRFLIGS